MPQSSAVTRSTRHAAPEVFVAFLRLGLGAFGGPIAHVAYMREAFVRRRAWLDDSEFAHLLALCQFLPGPSSSQLGFAIGMRRAGWRGALAAFAGFTLPSALLMLAFAFWAPRATAPWALAALHGLKLVAVVVVAHGLYSMARPLLRDRACIAIALTTAALLLLYPAPWMQLLAVAAGALVGRVFCARVALDTPDAPMHRAGTARGLALVLLYAAGLAIAVAWPITATPTPAAIAAAFYRAGALVFGGGHVVLPMLQPSLVASGWLDTDQFLAGYGAAQAVPGPMFSVAAYFGALLPTTTPAPLSALLALLAIFVPGGLLLSAALPVWWRVVTMPNASRAISGVNAAVVGLLAAAFYSPVCTGGVRSAGDAVIALAGVTALALRMPALLVVAGSVLASLLRQVVA